MRHNFFAPIIDIRRVGILGVGAGAVTALQMAGAAPDLANLAACCPTSLVLDPLCTNWVKQRHAAMRASFAAITARYGQTTLTPGLANLAGPSRPPESPAKGTAAKTAPEPEGQDGPLEPVGEHPSPPDRDGTLLRTLAPGLLQEYDPEPALLAVGLLTPGWIGLFPDSSIRKVTVPVALFGVHDDAVYPHETSSKRLQELLPQRPSSRILQNATHFDVQAPCPPVYLDTFPALCGPQGPDSLDARTLRNEFFIRFFEKHLGTPLPPPVQPEENEKAGGVARR